MAAENLLWVGDKVVNLHRFTSMDIRDDGEVWVFFSAEGDLLKFKGQEAESLLKWITDNVSSI